MNHNNEKWKPTLIVNPIPKQFIRFDCLEYFRDFQEGRYSASAHLWFILPVAEIGLHHEEDALTVGRPGVDGIEFCYRSGHSGIWAFYPIESEWRAVASTLKDLEERWTDGSLSV
jgi:hypothetical protein